MRKVGRKDDFPEGKAVAIEIDGYSIVICHLEGGKFYAIENRCSHDDGELGEGELEGCEIICPRHGARFDVRDGTVTKPPAVYPIDIYEVTLRHGDVYITLED